MNGYRGLLLLLSSLLLSSVLLAQTGPGNTQSIDAASGPSPGDPCQLHEVKTAWVVRDTGDIYACIPGTLEWTVINSSSVLSGDLTLNNLHLNGWLEVDGTTTLESQLTVNDALVILSQNVVAGHELTIGLQECEAASVSASWWIPECTSPPATERVGTIRLDASGWFNFAGPGGTVGLGPVSGQFVVPGPIYMPSGELRLASTTQGSATCLDHDTDRLYGDTNCDGSKDPVTEFYLDDTGGAPPIGGDNAMQMADGSGEFYGEQQWTYDELTGIVLLDTIPPEGTHDGGDGVAYLEDTTQDWAVDRFVGQVVTNLDTSSFGTITTNSETVLTAVMGSGTPDDLWDDGHAYRIEGTDAVMTLTADQALKGAHLNLKGGGTGTTYVNLEHQTAESGYKLELTGPSDSHEDLMIIEWNNNPGDGVGGGWERMRFFENDIIGIFGKDRGRQNTHPAGSYGMLWINQDAEDGSPGIMIEHADSPTFASENIALRWHLSETEYGAISTTATGDGAGGVVDEVGARLELMGATLPGDAHSTRVNLTARAGGLSYITSGPFALWEHLVLRENAADPGPNSDNGLIYTKGTLSTPGDTELWWQNDNGAYMIADSDGGLGGVLSGELRVGDAPPGTTGNEWDGGTAATDVTAWIAGADDDPAELMIGGHDNLTAGEYPRVTFLTMNPADNASLGKIAFDKCDDVGPSCDSGDRTEGAYIYAYNEPVTGGVALAFATDAAGGGAPAVGWTISGENSLRAQGIGNGELIWTWADAQLTYPGSNETILVDNANVIDIDSSSIGPFGQREISIINTCDQAHRGKQITLICDRGYDFILVDGSTATTPAGGNMMMTDSADWNCGPSVPSNVYRGITLTCVPDLPLAAGVGYGWVESSERAMQALGAGMAGTTSTPEVDMTYNYAWSGTQNWTTGDIRLGNLTDADATVYAYNGDANAPYLRYDAGTNAWVRANDGVTEVALGGAADGVGYDEIEDEGSGLTKRAVLNFIGAGVTCVDNDPTTDCTITGASISPANPTATVKLTAENGVASTYMRSDAAPALDVSISPVWTGTHIFGSVATRVAPNITLNSVGSVVSQHINNSSPYTGSWEFHSYASDLHASPTTNFDFTANTAADKVMAVSEGAGETEAMFIELDGTMKISKGNAVDYVWSNTAQEVATLGDPQSFTEQQTFYDDAQAMDSILIGDATDTGIKAVIFQNLSALGYVYLGSSDDNLHIVSSAGDVRLEDDVVITGTTEVNLDCSTGDQYVTTTAGGVLVCGTDDGGGGGEANTLASPDLGSEVDLINSVPKTGTALNLVSLEADDFSVTSNIITIDDNSHAHVEANITDLSHFTPTDIDTDYGDETVTSTWTINDVGTGALTAYDLTVGDSTDYGILRVGDAVIGRTSNTTGYNLDGALIFQNPTGPVTGDIEFGFLDSANLLRFALPKSGVGNATYNPRCMLNAGPAIADSDIVTVSYWQGTGIFDNLSCDTATDGSQLGVQGDVEFEETLFVDTISESTTAAGVTIDGVLIKDNVIDHATYLSNVGVNSHAQLDTHLGSSANPHSVTCAQATGCVTGAITGTGVTYENLSANGDIGFAASQVPQGALTAPLASPALTGDPTAPTATAGDSDTSVATTDFVDREERTKCKTVESLVAADDDVFIWGFRDAATVTAVGCNSDAAATVVVQDYGGTAVETIVCDTDGSITWDATISGTATFTSGEVMQFDTTSASTPTWTMICWSYRND